MHQIGDAPSRLYRLIDVDLKLEPVLIHCLYFHFCTKCLIVLEQINVNNSVSVNDICTDNMQIKWHILEVLYTTKRSAENIPL